MNKHFFIILDGPMGAGKTTVAKLLHRRVPRTSFILTSSAPQPTIRENTA